jgi:hypothetical protein
MCWMLGTHMLYCVTQQRWLATKLPQGRQMASALLPQLDHPLTQQSTDGVYAVWLGCSCEWDTWLPDWQSVSRQLPLLLL